LRTASDETMRVGIIIGWVCLGVVVLLLTCYCVNRFSLHAVNKVAPTPAVAGRARSKSFRTTTSNPDTNSQTTISNVRRPAVGLGQQGRLVFVGSRVASGVSPGVARAAPRAMSSAEPASVSTAMGDWPPQTSYSRNGAVSPLGLYADVRPDGDPTWPSGLSPWIPSAPYDLARVAHRRPTHVHGRRAPVFPSERRIGRLPPIVTTRWDGPTSAVELDGHVLDRRRLPPISTTYWHDPAPGILPDR
jgi:hypothetical protein